MAECECFELTLLICSGPERNWRYLRHTGGRFTPLSFKEGPATPAMPIRLGVIQLTDAFKKRKFDQMKFFEFVFCEANIDLCIKMDLYNHEHL